MRLHWGLRAAAVVATFAIALTGGHAAQPPNILFILADDLGWNDVSYHGASDARTPTIDAMAAQGMQLNNYYIQHICSPTRSALMSGKYPIHTGLQDGVIRPTSPYGLPLSETTIAQEMKRAGYRTAAIGKWHLGFADPRFVPTARGFDRYFGYYLGAEDYFYHNRSYNGVGGFDLRNQTDKVSTEAEHYSTNLFAEQIIDVIENHDTSDPLFIYAPFQAVHGPLQAPKKYLDQFKHVSPKNRQTKCAMLLALDEAIANVTQALRRTGMENNTLVVFSTDNGAPWPEGNDFPLRGSKATLWEGGVRGVGFVYGDLVPPAYRGTVNNELMHITDWLPTLASMAGVIPTSTTLDGVDQSDMLFAGAPSGRTEILHNLDPIGCDTPNKVCGAVRKGHMKLAIGHEIHNHNTWHMLDDDGHPNAPTVVCGSKRPTVGKDDCSVTQKPCLFNITADPCEHKNLADSLPEVVDELMALLEQYNETAVPPQQLAHPPDPSGADPTKHGGFWSPWINTEL